MPPSVLEAPSILDRGDSIEAAIGNTPLIRLRRVAANLPAGVTVHAKGEHLNPGGSVKDRPALAMILSGERNGLLRPGMSILDATSGNTGIAYAMIGAARGYHVTICLPQKASAQRKQILRSFGVEIIETDPLLATWLRGQVAALPAAARAVIVLRYQRELGPVEIAETLDMPLNTVKSHLKRSLAVLRARCARLRPGAGDGR